MASSLFPNSNPQPQMNRTVQGGNPMQMMAQIANIMRGKNPEQVAMNLMNQNPQFKQFMQSVKGKTPEQFAREHGMDFSQIMKMMK